MGDVLVRRSLMISLVFMTGCTLDFEKFEAAREAVDMGAPPADAMVAPDMAIIPDMVVMPVDAMVDMAILDKDEDGIPDMDDNCPETVNMDQKDTDEPCFVIVADPDPGVARLPR